MALLKIVRDSGYADRRRVYKVILDGKGAGKIGNGETIEFPVSAGQHHLALKIDWCGSNTVQFMASEGDVIIFDARSNLRGSRIWAALWRALFAWNSWIVLESRKVGQKAILFLMPGIAICCRKIPIALIL